jgi:cell division protein FtsI (penicillin-binding protein 3)
VAQSLGHEPVFQVFRRFGLGESSVIGFPGERSGDLRQRAHWSEIEQVTLAFGYGLTATPLQLAHAYSVFANRGRQVPLTLLRRDPDAKPVQRKVVDEDIVAQVNTVLERVTGDDGTGSHARVAGFAVGGKTGTVHKVGPGGYQDHDYLAFFVGIAPIDNPRFVTVVVIDEPRGNSYGGGSAAAPVYSRITEGVLRLKNAVPSMLVSDDATFASAGASS